MSVLVHDNDGKWYQKRRTEPLRQTQEFRKGRVWNFENEHEDERSLCFTFSLGLAEKWRRVFTRVLTDNLKHGVHDVVHPWYIYILYFLRQQWMLAIYENNPCENFLWSPDPMFTTVTASLTSRPLQTGIWGVFDANTMGLFSMKEQRQKIPLSNMQKKRYDSDVLRLHTYGIFFRLARLPPISYNLTVFF